MALAGLAKSAAVKPNTSVVEESKDKISTKSSNILLQGTLRKKGLIFLNERSVTISREGILNYYHFDKPGVVKGTLDLTSSQVQSVRFVYAGALPVSSTQPRPAQNTDDEFRIVLANRESFIFRASKMTQNLGLSNNPCIEKWECVIRRFTKNVRVGI